MSEDNIFAFYSGNVALHGVFPKGTDAYTQN